MNEALQYKLIENNGITIISLKGKISKDSKEIFDKCFQELLGLNSDVVIFYFKDVPAVERVALRDLTLLQHEIRKNKKTLFITGLSAILKQDLVEKGVIRLNEVKPTLEDALKKI